MNSERTARVAVAALALALSASAWATRSGQIADGRHYVSGGVSQGERDDLQARREAFSLWVITAAAKSGAYLAGVHVAIRDATRRMVFDGRLDGPWLFVDLPLGVYEVEASHGATTIKRRTTIHADDHHQAIFYFDVPDAGRPGGQPQR